VPPLLDLTGRRFGALAVVRRSDAPPQSGEAMWDCRCDCGREVVRRSGNLLRKVRGAANQSCGCKNPAISGRRKDIAGQRFGRWTVLARPAHSYGYWSCRCDCGTERDVYAPHLRAGKSLSCGCLRVEAMRGRPRPD
jgi:hypothetical protein